MDIKMKRKKIISILSILFLLTACTRGTQVINIKERFSEKKETEVVIAFAHKSMNSYFYLIMNEALKNKTEEKGWKFLSSVADYDAKRQDEQIIHFIEKEPDAIITTAIDSIAIGESVEKSNRSNIPICTIDTNSVDGETAIDVSFDNYKAGELAAKEIVKALIQKYNEPRGTVFNAYGELTSNAWRLRKEGFESVLNQYPNITYISENTKGQPQYVKEALKKAFATYEKIDAVHCSSEHPGRGMVEVLKETGRWYTKEEEDHIILVTIDADAYFMELIESGYADAAIAQDAIAYGEIIVDLLDDYVLANKSLDKDVYSNEDYYWKSCPIYMENNTIKVVIPPYVVDAGNCKDPLHWAHKARYIRGFQYNE